MRHPNTSLFSIYRYRLEKNLRMLFNNTPKVDPYAFIRVKNEKITLQASLDSISSVIRRGVIATHKLNPGEQDDGSLEILENFVKANSGYKLIYYPHTIFPPNHERYKDLDNLPKENRLEGFYNFTLSHIPQQEWLLKIDCDQIYEPKALEKILHMPKTIKDMIVLPRLDLHYTNNQLFFIRTNVTREMDHWLVYNKDLYFDTATGYDNNGKFYAYEQLRYPEVRLIETDLFTLHFPCMKYYRGLDNSIKLTPYDFNKISKKEALFYNISKDYFSEENILSICQKFSL